MQVRSELAGQKFGRLLAIKPLRQLDNHSWVWLCQCDCGAEKEVIAAILKYGDVKSCGCYRRDHTKTKFTTHGATGTPEHKIWKSLNSRCYNSNNKAFGDYGARGVSVFEEWHGAGGFQNFIAYVGSRPSPEHSLDRFPNNDGNYEPGNVRWATAKEQVANTRPQIALREIATLRTENNALRSALFCLLVTTSGQRWRWK